MVSVTFDGDPLKDTKLPNFLSSLAQMETENFDFICILKWPSWLSSVNQELNEDRFISRIAATLLYARQIFVTISLTGDD